MFDAVVTGGGRGLGVAIVRGLAMEAAIANSGARVIVTARDGVSARRTAELLRSEGLAAVEAYTPALDVASLQSVQAFARFATEELDLGLLVNNAAVCDPGWNRSVVSHTLRTNVIGPLSLARAVAPIMIRRGHGHIVTISSGDGELLYLHPGLQAALRAATTSRQVLQVLAQAAPPRDDLQGGRERADARLGVGAAHIGCRRPAHQCCLSRRCPDTHVRG